MSDDWKFQQVPGTDATTFIQWKGTEVCMDVTCPCGHHGHIDASFAYSLECPACGRFFDVGCAVAVRVVDEPQSDLPIVIDMPEPS